MKDYLLRVYCRQATWRDVVTYSAMVALIVWGYVS